MRDFCTKIMTVEDVARAVAQPRQAKVVMCHGVFDVVHPGHVRHMLYAKSKGDILVASVTCDEHVHKGVDRPHVPERIRAENLAAYEFVDYVIINRDPVPLRAIDAIKPDVFAKGYEYQVNGLTLKSQAESDLVGGYGGEMLFTPGDYVLSSSQLIAASPPNLRVDRLADTMRRFGLTFDALRRTLDCFDNYHVHVVGDVIVDTLLNGVCMGASTKTPTLSVRIDKRTDYIGGAGAVASHLRAAGAQALLSTVVGDDECGKFVMKNMPNMRVIVDATRPTTRKEVVVAGGSRLLKLDSVDNQPISETIIEGMAQMIAKTSADAIVFSDFRHGIFNRHSIPILTAAIPEGVFRAADSQVSSRWGNILDFQGFDLITPNEREARFSLGDQDSGVRPLAGALSAAARCRALILKLGERGAICRTDDDFIAVDSFVDTFVDGVGAGDALLAYATLGMLATKSHVIATIIGIMAAACECERNGNIPITVDDVRSKLDLVEREKKYA